MRKGSRDGSRSGPQRGNQARGQGKKTASGGCPQEQKNATERISMLSHTEESLNELPQVTTF